MNRTTLSERALVLAPRGRDAAIAVTLLQEAELPASPCAGLSVLIEELKAGAAYIILTEDELGGADLAPLSAWLDDQQEWSDLPFILLTKRGGGLERNPAARRLLDVLGNVTFLERPFHPLTLVSLARSALRGRRRQYQARARMEALRESEELLRAAVAAVQRANDTLEQRVAEAISQRAKVEDALRQAQKMEAIGQLTGGVAHDFNNLMTIIKSAAQFLRKPELPDERRRRYLDVIVETIDRGSKLTSQLLAFARRQALKPEPFDVRERVLSITDMLGAVMGSRTQIITAFTDERILVEADIAQFETALVNMAVNARDAMNGEGKLTVKVGAASAAAVKSIKDDLGRGKSYVAVSLTDTGTGIPSDRLGLIFEPFFTTKAVGKGTGLGLSQVYGFAKQSGGDIQVESTLGVGTTFTLVLPRIEKQVALTDRVEKPDGSRFENGLGRRVLLVEDNVDVGAFSHQLLRDLGYQSTWVKTGDEALKVLSEADDFDAVFSDIVMPGITGIELGYEIRRRYPGLPVVLTSGYSPILAEEVDHGFHLLHKPYQPEDLSRVLHEAFGMRTGSRARRTDIRGVRE